MSLKIRLLKIFFSVKRKSIIKNPQKILLIKTGAIGDILMTTPLMREIRRLFPSAKIDYLVGNWSKDVLKNNPNINSIISFDEKIMLKKRIFKVLSLIKKIRKQNYDLCFVLDRSYLINLFAYFCNIPYRIGFDRDGEGFTLTNPVKAYWNNHHIKEYLRLLEPYNIKSKKCGMEVFLSKKDKDIIKKILDRIIIKKTKKGKLIGIAPLSAVNPGETAFNRRWPKENYVEIINKLLKQNSLIFLFGGSNEFDEIEKLRQLFKNKNRIFNCANLNIQQSVLLMKKMNLFLTHDSGPMHMASCANTKVLTLFGPTNPNEKAPLNKGSSFIWKNHHLIKKGIQADYLSRSGMEKISIEEVYNKTREMLKTRK